MIAYYVSHMTYNYLCPDLCLTVDWENLAAFVSYPSFHLFFDSTGTWTLGFGLDS
jgi:hypothetical protein